MKDERELSEMQIYFGERRNNAFLSYELRVLRKSRRNFSFNLVRSHDVADPLGNGSMWQLARTNVPAQALHKRRVSR